MNDDSRPDQQLSRAAAFWNQRHQEVAGDDHDNFLAHPLVYAYVSLRCTGEMNGHLDLVTAELRARTGPGDRILSIGCGPAGKEMILAQSLPDRQFVATDIADEVLDLAREECDRRGIHNLELRYGDFNRFEIEPDAYQVVLGMGSLHHVEALENFWQQCRSGLRGGGVLMAQEYVGAPRFQWPEAQCRAATDALTNIVPEQHKPHHKIVTPPPLEHMLAVDPSEAVRSDEIISTAEAAGFAIEGYTGAGCALLQPVLMNQITTFDPQDWQHNLVLARLFEEEARLMDAGVIGDDFAVFVAHPPA